MTDQGEEILGQQRKKTRAAPVERTSVRDRMAHASAPVPDLASPSLGDSSELTSTSLAAFTLIQDYSTAFTVSDTGVTRTDAFAPISAPISTSEPAKVLRQEDADSHHLLLLPEEVDPAEIEALALSIWDEACWMGAGRLHLTAQARLEGPWAIDTATRHALGTPSAMTKAWILHCPSLQRQAIPAELAGIDEWAPYFPKGLPLGLEYRVLLALKRIARRLSGALRIADSGRVFQPDPDSAVSLAIYTSRWLDPAELIDLLHADFPQIVDSRDVPLSLQKPVTSAKQTILKDTATSCPEAKTSGAKASGEKALGAKTAVTGENCGQDTHTVQAPQVVSGYALLIPVGNRSELMIEVQPVAAPPQVLRWEAWATGVIIEYQLRWIPQESMSVPSALSRARRLERLRSARDIENAAGIIVSALGGSVIDEDGFLVGLEDEAVIE